MPESYAIVSIKIPERINEALIAIASVEKKTRHAIAKRAVLEFLEVHHNKNTN